MPNYENGKIYKIMNDENDRIYVGSTTVKLSERLSGHRRHKKRFELGTLKHGCSSFQLLELLGVKIILIESYPCQTVEELLAREQYWMDEFKDRCVNVQRANGQDPVKKKRNRIKYNLSEAGIAKVKEYNERPEVIAKRTAYETSEKRVLYKKEYNKKFLQEHKQEKSEYKKTQVLCEPCNKLISRGNFWRHNKLKHRT